MGTAYCHFRHKGLGTSGDKMTRVYKSCLSCANDNSFDRNSKSGEPRSYFFSIIPHFYWFTITAVLRYCKETGQSSVFSPAKVFVTVPQLSLASLGAACYHLPHEKTRGKSSAAVKTAASMLCSFVTSSRQCVRHWPPTGSSSHMPLCGGVYAVQHHERSEMHLSCSTPCWSSYHRTLVRLAEISH
jgi:hypothetical protein